MFFKNVFGFKPRNVDLYRLALLHRSASQKTINGLKNSNERMEYLGDAVLSSVIADYLFFKYPFKDEGFLTEMRSKIVNRANLNNLSRKMGLDKMVQSEQDEAGTFRSINGDAFEAIIGAIYLDRGYKFVKKIIVKRIISCYIDIEELEKKELNYKSALLELTQKTKKSLEFKVIDRQGSGNRKQYVIAVFINGSEVAKGYGYTIKEAENNGAALACNNETIISDLQNGVN